MARANAAAGRRTDTSANPVSCIVVYQVRFISSKTGRTDYALTGESIELSCHYLMKDDLEDIKSVHWSKDGVNFIRWSKYRPGIEVLDYTFKGHVDNSTTHSHLLIHNATVDMHGKYKCLVRTDLGHHEHEQQLVVISEGQCKQNVWRVASDQLQCRETFRLDCRQMFPRPVPSCGLWNDRTDKFIRSVAVDISEEPASAPAAGHRTNTRSGGGGGASNNPKQTYRVRYTDKFELVHLANGSLNQANVELLRFAGHLVFKCDISVPDTSWRLSMSHKMFNYFDGCEQDPLEFIERKRAEFKQFARSRLAAPNMVELVHHPPASQLPEDAARRQQNHREPAQGPDPQASKLTYELLLPSQVRRLTHRNKYGGPGELQHNSRASAGGDLSHHNNDSQTKRLSYTNEDLNCWQKPRLGTIVKLSCGNGQASNTANLVQSQRQSTANSRAHSVKLTGTNLLECKSGGWQLVRETNAINNEILDTKAYKVLMRKRKKSTSLGAAASDSLPTQELPAGNTRAAGKSEDEDDDDPTARAARTGHKDQTRPSAAATPVPLSNEKEEATIPPADTMSSAAGPQEEDEPDDADGFVIDQQQQPTVRQEPELSPEQLATLLPTCVSIAHKRRQQRPGVSGLPLLDHGTVLGASTHSKMAHQQDADWRWYSFGLSNAPRSSSLTSRHPRRQQLLLILVALPAAALLQWLLHGRPQLVAL